MTTDPTARPIDRNTHDEFNVLNQQVEHLMIAAEHELRAAGPSGLSELALIKTLQSERWQVIGSVDFSRTEQLYPVHFLLFHALYRLNDELFPAGERIQLSPLQIRLCPASSSGNTSLPGAKDSLREFYMDLEQYYLSNTEIADMMDRFWTGTIVQKPNSASVASAAEVLGFDSVPPTFDTAKRRFRKLMMKVHPDRGGSTLQVQHLNDAFAVLKAHYS